MGCFFFFLSSALSPVAASPCLLTEHMPVYRVPEKTPELKSLAEKSKALKVRESFQVFVLFGGVCAAGEARVVDGERKEGIREW